MKKHILPVLVTAVMAAATVILISACGEKNDSTAEGPIAEGPGSSGDVIPLPSAGRFYHGVFPHSGAGRGEGEITPEGVDSYEDAAGKSVAWVYFSHDWYQGRSFPYETAVWVRDRGSIPFIRLMLRSSDEQDVAEPLFTLDAIIEGEFDEDLRDWFAAASGFSSPLIVEFGTEVNGNWFSWNGEWNGGGETEAYGDVDNPDGPERFRDAYRHIIDISRDEGAENIVWVFHIDQMSVPDKPWNSAGNYYPGDDWIDWIGLSVYGPTEPDDHDASGFRDLMEDAYDTALAISPEKPVVLCEFGATDGNPAFNQAEWARESLELITSNRWPRLIGFSWWNERWENDDDPANDSRLMIQENPELAAVFQELVGGNESVLGHIITVEGDA